jgi:cytochrome c2
MNIEGLRNDPLYYDPRFQVASLRTHDLLAIQSGENEYDLYASFDRFAGTCIQFVVSRIRLRVDQKGISPVSRWTDIWNASPCLRFKDRGSLLEGWQQGGRMVQKSRDEILISIGDYQRDGLYDSQAVSMDPAFDHGKLIELNVRTGAARRVAVGLRNPQGLMIDEEGRIWETEHGPQGGDEINLIVEGRSYGWPVETFGMNYGSPPMPWPGMDGRDIEASYEQPRFAFLPSIGISNLVAPDTSEFPAWENSLIVCSLAAKTLYVVRLVRNDIVFTEPIAMGHRLRDIAVLPSGRLAILADGGVLFLVKSARDSIAEQALEVSGLSSLTPPSAEEAPGRVLSAAGRGKAYFSGSCAGCHSIAGEILAGPPLDGVVNRAVASVEGFRYSDALTELGGTWTERRLANFIHYPETIAIGTSMPASGLHHGESADVVAFLKTIR